MWMFWLVFSLKFCVMWFISSGCKFLTNLVIIHVNSLKVSTLQNNTLFSKVLHFLKKNFNILVYITGRCKLLLTWLLMPFCTCPKNLRSIDPVTRFWNLAIGRWRIRRVWLTESLPRLCIAITVWTVHTGSITMKVQVRSQVKKRNDYHNRYINQHAYFRFNVSPFKFTTGRYFF